MAHYVNHHPNQVFWGRGAVKLKEAEHVESQSAETVLTPDECQLLGYLDKGKRKRKEKAGSLQWAYMAIARLGGFMDSKRTGIASWGALW